MAQKVSFIETPTVHETILSKLALVVIPKSEPSRQMEDHQLQRSVQTLAIVTERQSQSARTHAATIVPAVSAYDTGEDLIPRVVDSSPRSEGVL